MDPARSGRGGGAHQSMVMLIIWRYAQQCSVEWAKHCPRKGSELRGHNCVMVTGYWLSKLKKVNVKMKLPPSLHSPLPRLTGVRTSPSPHRNPTPPVNPSLAEKRELPCIKLEYCRIGSPDQEVKYTCTKLACHQLYIVSLFSLGILVSFIWLFCKR
jgi:hypothetical protein